MEKSTENMHADLRVERVKVTLQALQLLPFCFYYYFTLCLKNATVTPTRFYLDVGKNRLVYKHAQGSQYRRRR